MNDISKISALRAFGGDVEKNVQTKLLEGDLDEKTYLQSVTSFKFITFIRWDRWINVILLWRVILMLENH